MLQVHNKNFHRSPVIDRAPGWISPGNTGPGTGSTLGTGHRVNTGPGHRVHTGSSPGNRVHTGHSPDHRTTTGHSLDHRTNAGLPDKHRITGFPPGNLLQWPVKDLPHLDLPVCNRDQPGIGPPLFRGCLTCSGTMCLGPGKGGIGTGIRMILWLATYHTTLIRATPVMGPFPSLLFGNTQLPKSTERRGAIGKDLPLSRRNIDPLFLLSHIECLWCRRYYVRALAHPLLLRILLSRGLLLRHLRGILTQFHWLPRRMIPSSLRAGIVTAAQWKPFRPLQ